MHRGEAEQREASITTDGDTVCGDRFPHLRGDFTTCTKPCQRSYGHRPAMPHRCADGHEWSIDFDRFDTRSDMLENHMEGEIGS
jgi:hypothetical protein